MSFVLSVQVRKPRPIIPLWTRSMRLELVKCIGHGGLVTDGVTSVRWRAVATVWGNVRMALE